MCLCIDYILGSWHPYGNEISEDRLWMLPSMALKERRWATSNQGKILNETLQKITL